MARWRANALSVGVGRAEGWRGKGVHRTREEKENALMHPKQQLREEKEKREPRACDDHVVRRLVTQNKSDHMEG